LRTNLTNAIQNFDGSNMFVFNSDGFSLNGGGGDYNDSSPDDYVSWTFRKAPKFFDVVTYTGNGTSGREIAHDLGCDAGMIVVKKTSGSAKWCVYHKSLGTGKELHLNKTDAATSYGDLWSGATDTTFTVSANNNVNYSGDDYVAYLFAHDPDGEDDDGRIACGSYTGNGSSDGPEIDLGWEPQYVMVKCVDTSSPWTIWDVMRGFANNGTGDDKRIKADTSDAEGNSPFGHPTSTGIKITGTNGDYNTSGDDYIYMAIRAPMMVEPESATDVFDVTTYTGAGAGTQVDVGFAADMQIVDNRTNSSNSNTALYDRLRGVRSLITQQTWTETDESSYGNTLTQHQTIIESIGSSGYTCSSGSPYVSWAFKRAKGFFDVVAYSGDSVAGRELSHSLGVAPEMIWIRCRNSGEYSPAYHKDVGNDKHLFQQLSNSETSSSYWDSTTPTDTVFTLGSDNRVNSSSSSQTYIAYLFASLAGISKVGSYTGTGSALNIDCGFSNGARFVLIKRSDGTGHWAAFDTERGIVAGNDAMLLLNETDSENTATDHIDPYSSGFALSGDSEFGGSGREYIYLAIA
jgi:hypothetical protein